MHSQSILIVFLSLLLSITQATWSNCGNSLSTSMFQDFTIFPNPANIGDTVYIRAVVQPDSTIQDGTVQFRIWHNETDPINPAINIPGIPLCTLTESISCPIAATSNIYSWQFVVPDVPTGTYVVRYDVKPSTASLATPGCLVFTFEVENATASANQTEAYTTWYEATLGGSANFEHMSVAQRSIGEIVQVGPIGLLPSSVAGGFSYGIFSSVVGSGDLVPAGGLNTQNYIWGMYGSMTKKIVTSTSVQHVFEGEFYVGFNPNFTNYTDSLFSGSFTLTWVWNSDYSQASLNGHFNNTQDATLPAGWPSPVLFGLLNSVIYTDEYGALKASGSSVFCVDYADGVCPPNSTIIGGAIASGGASSDFTKTQLGVTIGVILGFAFLVLVLVAFITWRRNKRETEEEDGVFAVARKPEYGSALILDDIIQETQGRNRDLRPMIDPRRRPQAEDSLSEDDDFGYGNESYSPSRSPSGRRSDDRSISRSMSQPPNRDLESGDESRSRSRSIDRRSPSNSRVRSSSRSRSPSKAPPTYHSEDDQSSEEDPGSSASRASGSEESDA